MPQLTLSRAHAFSPDEASTRLRHLLAVVQSDLARFVDRIEWAPDGRSAKVRGPMFKGRFAVEGGVLRVELDVSVLATLFMEKIRTRIESTLDLHFLPSRGPVASLHRYITAHK